MGRFLVCAVIAAAILEFCGYMWGMYVPIMFRWDVNPEVHAILRSYRDFTGDTRFGDWLGVPPLVAVTAAGFYLQHLAWDNANWWLCHERGDGAPVSHPGWTDVRFDNHPIVGRQSSAIQLAVAPFVFGIYAGQSDNFTVLLAGAAITVFGWAMLILTPVPNKDTQKN